MTEAEIRRPTPPEVADLPENFWSGGRLVTLESDHGEAGTTSAIDDPRGLQGRC